MPSTVGLRVLYLLIFLSGSAGLIFQVVWHKYLAILLGAQARATAIVLAIFLGGISAGYLVFGRWSRWKKWNLLKAYSFVELGLGAWAFFFPKFFALAVPMTAKMYASLGVNNIAIDFVMAILLIGAPTFLMGGTLPLLTQGLAKDLGEASKTHSRIYGFNTLGACLGCLFAGYYLIPSTSLSAALYFGGLLNGIVSFVTYFFFASRSEVQNVEGDPKANLSTGKLTRTQMAIIGIGFLSGFYLITLETVLIRLMGLSTGSSNYNFTLIVAIFIFGLGAGALSVKNIDKYTTSRLFWNQMFVAAGMLFVYVSGNYWSYIVHVIRVMLRDIPQAFYFFQFSLGLAFSFILIVPVALSGITLPLCFHLIKDTKEGLGNRVGQLYGVNTIGCVLGAFFGGYVLLNFIDLDQLFKVCVLLALVSTGAAAYIYIPTITEQKFGLVGPSVGFVVVLMGLLISPRYDKLRFVQPFRHPQPLASTFEGAEAFGRYLGRTTEFLLWKDGPNTSLGVGASKYQGKEVSRTIFINGKSDGNTRGDLFTTVMLAHIPALLSKKIENTCIIGFGTGMTIGTVMNYPEVQRVDVVEIANTVIENAHYFDPYNNGVSKNAKVHFNEMDAFRFFHGTNKSFDIVISEPSNPWVAGIENLYSLEFYKTAFSKMSDDGTFVQWMHTYSLNDDLFKMVMRTMNEVFPLVSVFQLKGGDLALVGRKVPFQKTDFVRGIQRMSGSAFVKQSLAEAGLTRFESVLALELIPPPATKVIAEGAGLHTLESPKLSNEAAKAFFVGNSARVQALRRQYKEFYPSIESSLLAQFHGEQPLAPDVLEAFKDSFCENPSSKNTNLCEETLAMKHVAASQYQVEQKYDEIANLRELASLSAYHKDFNKTFNADSLKHVYQMFESYKKFASPIARIPTASFVAQVDLCLKTIVYADELFGECLLQKILILETVRLSSPEFVSAVNQYLDWFPNLSPKSENYSRLEEAKTILSRMLMQRK